MRTFGMITLNIQIPSFVCLFVCLNTFGKLFEVSEKLLKLGGAGACI